MTPLLARRAAPDRAFESFYRKHVGEVYHYAPAVLANPADAEALLFRARRGLKVRRKALGVISAVPVPGSLSSFFGGGGGLVAGGLLGGTALKIAAAVTAGMVAAGAGYQTVKAVAGGKPPASSPGRSRIPPAILQAGPFDAAFSNVFARHSTAAAKQFAAASSNLVGHRAHRRSRNADLARLIGRGRDNDTSVAGTTTAAVGTAVTTVTSYLPA